MSNIAQLIVLAVALVLPLTGSPVASQVPASTPSPPPTAVERTPVLHQVRDFTGDGRVDPAVWRPSTGVWWVKGRPSVQWGRPGDTPVPADYDGDGKADIAVWRPSTAVWWIRQSGGGIRTIKWGVPGDIPMPDSYPCTAGQVRPAVWRPTTGVWWVHSGSAGCRPTKWGQPGDVPNAGGYENPDSSGDSPSYTVWRPETATFYVRDGQLDRKFPLGVPGDVPVPPAFFYMGEWLSVRAVVWRPANATWYGRGELQLQWGQSGDIPVPGNYTGSDRGDFAVWRPSNGTWYVRGGATVQWGQSGDIPV